MNVHWTFRNCDRSKARARKFLDMRLPRLRRRLSTLGPEDSQLDLTLYHHPGHDSWELRAVLKLPTGSLVSTSEQNKLETVVDEVVKLLTQQLRRHKSRVRREHVIRRRRQRGREFVTATPFLEQDVARDRREEFFQLLSPLLDNIREHAAQELRSLERESAIPIGEYSVDDLVDEVIVLAYDRFKLRPPDALMETWLMSLLHERLDRFVEQEPPMSLTPPSIAAATGHEDDFGLDIEDVNYWMSTLFEEDDDVRLEELVPDDAVALTLQELDADEEKRRLTRLLNKLPKRQRQAIMLREASGFEESEIATMLSIPESKVSILLETARSTLRKHLANMSLGSEG